MPFLTTSIKADRDAKMGIVTDVKQELRKANALKLNYSSSLRSEVLLRITLQFKTNPASCGVLYLQPNQIGYLSTTNEH